MHIVEILGPSSSTEKIEHFRRHLLPLPFLADILCCTRVCQRWKRVVRTNESLWKSIGACRFHWYDNVQVSELKFPPRLQPDVKGERAKWMELYARSGKRMMESAWGRGDAVSDGDANTWLLDNYLMMVEVYVTDTMQRVFSAMGSMALVNLDAVQFVDEEMWHRRWVAVAAEEEDEERVINRRWWPSEEGNDADGSLADWVQKSSLTIQVGEICLCQLLLYSYYYYYYYYYYIATTTTTTTTAAAT